jgi:hypothetical protein
MLRLLRARERRTPRKDRLFACACVRRVRHLLVDERSRAALDVAEQCADGGVGAAARAAAEEAASVALGAQAGKEGLAAVAAWLAVSRRCAVARVLDYAAWSVRHSYPEAQGSVAEGLERGEQACLARECFADPSRRAPPAGAALPAAGGAFARLALAAYQERASPDGALDPDRLAVLADALEEASCDNADILTHLRGPGPHVRGCWALDLILGKQ